MSGNERHPAHEEYDELAVGWALGALEPDDESRFGRHLEDCGRCQQTVDDAHDVSAALAMALPPEQPSAALRDRILAAVGAEPRAAEPDPPNSSRRSMLVAEERALSVHVGGHRAEVRPSRFASLRHGLGLRELALAAALALVAGLGIWNVALHDAQEQTQSTVVAQAAVLGAFEDRGIYRLAPLSTGDGAAVGMVVVHDGAAQVLANGLPLNDTDDSTFVLWGLGPSGSPDALGTFDVTTTALDVRTVSSQHTGLDQYDGYAISLETGRTAPSAPTGMVATGTVGS